MTVVVRADSDGSSSSAQVALVDARRSVELIGFDRRQRRVFRGLGVAWLVVVVAFVLWWFRADHMVSWPRLVVSSLLLAWTLVLPAWYLYFVGRATRVGGSCDPPSGRVAMVVTKAPSEPFAIVQRTLSAMLAQQHHHDTWLADEEPDDATLQWCDAHGVKVCSRYGVEGYHQPTWPRREKCKEGNLAYFYDTFGYELYDFVVQLDADHVPMAGYLEAMLRPFSDPAIGYVSAPSICDSNMANSWSARARAYAEAGLHGALQAGANEGFAPLCIGSHYAVRTHALRLIGGLGPELAEDHSTTLLLNAAGWRGTHASDAIAHGDGPESFTDLMVQEFQWSRSLTNLLLTVTPGVLRKLPWRLRVQFLFSQLWYPMYAGVMLASVIAPIVALSTATPWMRLPYPIFVAYAAAISTCLLLIMAWLKRQGWMRPIDAPLLSWESALFQIVRWPWVLAGTLAAVADSIRGHSFSFSVTPKGGSGVSRLPFAAVAPYLAIGGGSALASLVIGNAGEASGYYWFTLVNAVIYSTAVAAVLVLHRRENPRPTSQPSPVRAHAAVLIAVVALTVAACASRGGDISTALTWTGDTAPVTADSAIVGTIDVTMGSVNIGVYDFTGAFSGSDRFAVGHHFVNWLEFEAAQIAALVAPDVASGRWPLLTVEPFPVAGAEVTLLQDVANGRYDAQVEAICQGLADAGSPAFVRWGHEMENVTGRYPWSTTDASAYVDAFRHVETQCRAVLGEDLYMVWSPVGQDGLAAYWPGAEFVDYVGLSVYDFPEYAAVTGGDPNWSFDDQFSVKYNRVAAFDRPVMIAEFGTTRSGADGLDWINDAFASTPKYPLLQTIVFFDAPDTPGVWGDAVDTPDWTIDPRRLPNSGD